jgi:hypothetical protein
MYYYMKTDLRELWSQTFSTLAFSKAEFSVSHPELLLCFSELSSCHSESSEESTQDELAGGPRFTWTTPTTELFSADSQFRHCEARQQRSNLSSISNSCHSECSEESSRSESAGRPRFSQTTPTTGLFSADSQSCHCEARQQRSNPSLITNPCPPLLTLCLSELPFYHSERSEESTQNELAGGPGFTRTVRANTLFLKTSLIPQFHRQVVR